ncbi:polyprenol reductase 2-like [Melia azedarach]|uniref:Polyprenol reductase 2-like n=2 Tax=Melia azedarach TaxID=155640 RepID=A0ACC1XZ13_MELAZ|nr:polyprenol reductase 2-like [Melia azedarach]KAJ4716654.1 polyprenol reductase 2-like [Melia azedarach]
MVSWIEGLLIAYWLPGIVPASLALIPSSRFNSFRAALSNFSKRTNIPNSSSSNYKLTVPWTFFWHFYAFAVVWTALLLSTTWMYAYKIAPSVSEPSQLAFHNKSRLTSPLLERRHAAWRSVFLLLLMEIHVLKRLIETISEVKSSPSTRMHISVYLFSLFSYTAAPLSLCCTVAPEAFKFAADQVAEFIDKGKSQMRSSEFDWWESVLLNPLTKLSLYQWIGAAIFLWGWIRQLRCHAILRSLKEHGGQIGMHEIPRGDWFEIVSCPQYLAEIALYAGLLVASGGADITIWLLFAYVAANLTYGAAETHRSYLRKFDNYPSNRFAIFPFIY